MRRAFALLPVLALLAGCGLTRHAPTGKINRACGEQGAPVHVGEGYGPDGADYGVRCKDGTLRMVSP